jgi:hypothetical protein
VLGLGGDSLEPVADGVGMVCSRWAALAMLRSAMAKSRIGATAAARSSCESRWRLSPSEAIYGLGRGGGAGQRTFERRELVERDDGAACRRGRQRQCRFSLGLLDGGEALRLDANAVADVDVVLLDRSLAGGAYACDSPARRGAGRD